jgi:hypothetical protein
MAPGKQAEQIGDEQHGVWLKPSGNSLMRWLAAAPVDEGTNFGTSQSEQSFRDSER